MLFVGYSSSINNIVPSRLDSSVCSWILDFLSGRRYSRWWEWAPSVQPHWLSTVKTNNEESLEYDERSWKPFTEEPKRGSWPETLLHGMESALPQSKSTAKSYTVYTAEGICSCNLLSIQNLYNRQSGRPKESLRSPAILVMDCFSSRFPHSIKRV